jgi:hypothetical protein
VIIAILWFVFAFVVAFGAHNRGRSGLGWFVLAILLSPVLAGIALIIVGKPRGFEERERIRAQKDVAQEDEDRVTR